MDSKKILLIDGSSYIYRSFYALKELSTSGGFSTNAIYGFIRILLKVLKDYQPEYLAIVFDSPKPTFREKIYPAYKAQRAKMPDTLVPQIPYIKKVVQAFRIPSFEKAGYEADDIIGTLVKQLKSPDRDIVIITGDKDLMQLVAGRVTIFDTMKNITVGIKEVKERFGVEPEGIPEVFGLMGDTSDNIPGVPGIGEKTAVKLIKDFGTIKELFQHLDRVKNDKLRDTLSKFKDQAEQSKSLTTIDQKVPLDCRLSDLQVSAPDTEALRSLFKELEFSKLLKELAPEKSAAVAQGKEHYYLVTEESELKKLLPKLNKTRTLTLNIETTEDTVISSELVGIALTSSSHEAYYFPFKHDYTGVPKQLALKSTLEILRPILENEKTTKIGREIKSILILLKRHGIELAGPLYDIAIASYLLNPAKHDHRLEEITRSYLGHEMTAYEAIAGKGQKQLAFNQLDLTIAKSYAAEKADLTHLASQILLPKLKENNLWEMFEFMEMSLVHVLAQMEMDGVKIDIKFLKILSRDLQARITKLENKIYQLAGEKFNIDSPKQLQEILFKKLGLTALKRTKTGFSTNSDVLAKLAQKGAEVPALILEYRQLAKLKNTYIDSFPELVDSRTKRLHTSYNQTVTATGRLSSSNPNLQNIPIKTKEGAKIRKAFITEPNHILIAADYSQIELRILAHLSKEPALIHAFKKDKDIHTRTATEIFSVSDDSVTSEMRRVAKVINFGIIYGMSAHGLSAELKIDHVTAQEYIDNYFLKHPEVQRYIQETIESVRKQGYVVTMFGRKRFLPEIKSHNVMVRNFAERAAVNAPIQGAAADIIKKAMINIQNRLHKEGLKSRMIMQVHDELIFEVPKKEEASMKEFIRKEMEEVVTLAVPLKADLSCGPNWAELESI